MQLSCGTLNMMYDHQLAQHFCVSWISPDSDLYCCADGFKRADARQQPYNTCTLITPIRVSASPEPPFSRHVMSSVGDSWDTVLMAASEISLPHPPSGHRDRQIFRKRVTAPSSATKPTTYRQRHKVSSSSAATSRRSASEKPSCAAAL